ncbi:DNA polymerase IV [Lentilactobacillus laojiaonis]|uniref:DNA polymerase IV n=1 Tax=Lentilactobacillus laojiaonis TaxID=2883998 RepID=UPI001D09FA09|nr:DNA polymerase IV [Lentilactobacillus laojiaonis]UDM31708.1 DNA polymerase IV [Lentilactobacillus laojiaonis]
MGFKNRKIIHIDMDAFYASIEEREDPSLKNKPLVVANDPRKMGGKGVVSTANYIARKYGIHSAMSSQKALKLCPQAVFRFTGFKLYRAVSNQIHEIFHEYTDKIEYYALDEAYLDVTENKLKISNPIKIATMIRKEILAKTKLTCSVGISYNKFLAKEASDYAKPNGLTIIDERDAIDFLKILPIEKFRGVGKKTLPKMHEMNIYNGEDLLKVSETILIQKFGKFGYYLYRRARGIDQAEVQATRIRKSIGKERTFSRNLVSREEVQTHVKEIAKLVENEMLAKRKHGKTLVLKLRYDDFKTITKRVTFEEYIKNDSKEFTKLAMDIFDEDIDHFNGFRLIGITITNLDDLTYQNINLELFI